MDLLAVLPRSSFVPFTAHRLAHPQVVWANEEDGGIHDLLDHAFCIPVEGEPASAFSNNAKTYYAERYGGLGVARNGGGARCGTVGLAQIKGIGRTPLVGVQSGTSEHSYGGASLQETVREALWGEICQIALPFGAVRSYGIIETGTRVPNFGLRDVVATTPRALVLREPVLRPAHFIRSPYFMPQMSLAISDVERTKAAVAILPAVLRNTLLPSDASADLAECLMEVSRRFAWQQAAAQAKRLIHGALASTNIALDGRWLDFGTIGMASDYGRAVVSVQPDAWLQFTLLIEPLQGLVFHLKKYLPKYVGVIPTERELIQEYLRTLAGRLRCEFTKLTGIPETSVKRLARTTVERFCECVQKIIARGNRYSFDLYAWGRPAVSGCFHLNTLMKIAAIADSPSQADTALVPHIVDEPLRRELVESYWALRSAYLKSAGGGEQKGLAYLRVNAIRVNTIVEELCRPALDKRIEQLVADGGSVAGLIETLVAKAKTFLAEPKDGCVNLNAIMEGAMDSRVPVKLEADNAACARAVLTALADHWCGKAEGK